MTTVCFQALTYHAEDEDGRYFVRIFGKDQQGQSVCVKTSFSPYFFIAITPGESKDSILYKIKKRMVTINRDYDEEDEDADPKDKWIDLKSHIIDASVVNRKRYWGFENGREHPFLRLVFKSYLAMQRASKLAENEGFDRYEANINPILRFLHVRDLQSTGWMQATQCKPIPSNQKQTTCDIEVTCAWTNIDPVTDMSSQSAPFVMASWDIEAMSTTGGFPSADLAGDVVFQIATTFQRFGHPEPHLRHLINLGTCDPIDGVEIVCVQSEKDLLKAWVDVLRRENVDISIG